MNKIRDLVGNIVTRPPVVYGHITDRHHLQDLFDEVQPSIIDEQLAQEKIIDAYRPVVVYPASNTESAAIAFTHERSVQPPSPAPYHLCVQLVHVASNMKQYGMNQIEGEDGQWRRIDPHSLAHAKIPYSTRRDGECLDDDDDRIDAIHVPTDFIDTSDGQVFAQLNKEQLDLQKVSTSTRIICDTITNGGAEDATQLLT